MTPDLFQRGLPHCYFPAYLPHTQACLSLHSCFNAFVHRITSLDLWGSSYLGDGVDRKNIPVMLSQFFSGPSTSNISCSKTFESRLHWSCILLELFRGSQLFKVWVIPSCVLPRQMEAQAYQIQYASSKHKHTHLVIVQDKDEMLWQMLLHN